MRWYESVVVLVAGSPHVVRHASLAVLANASERSDSTSSNHKYGSSSVVVVAAAALSAAVDAMFRCVAVLLVDEDRKADVLRVVVVVVERADGQLLPAADVAATSRGRLC